jgi:hypothetical protein
VEEVVAALVLVALVELQEILVAPEASVLRHVGLRLLGALSCLEVVFFKDQMVPLGVMEVPEVTVVSRKSNLNL